MRFFSALSLLFSATIFASPTLYFSRVLDSEEVRSETDKGRELISIENTQTFRCPGCYEFALTFRDEQRDGTIVQFTKVLETSLNIETLEIKIIERKK